MGIHVAASGSVSNPSQVPGNTVAVHGQLAALRLAFPPQSPDRHLAMLDGEVRERVTGILEVAIWEQDGARDRKRRAIRNGRLIST